MANTVGCTLDIYGTNSTAMMINPSPEAMAILDIRIRHRYQLSHSINGVVTLIDDILSPVFQSLFQIPLHIIALPGYRKLYISGIVSSLNLDTDCRHYLEQHIAGFAVNMAERSRWQGFVMVAEVVVMEVALVGEEELIEDDEEEEIARLVDESMVMDGGDFVRNGASRSAIEKLKEERFVGGDDLGLQTCVVCLEELLGGAMLTRMPCSHLFHGSCIVRWLEENNSCPLCRYELV